MCKHRFVTTALVFCAFVIISSGCKRDRSREGAAATGMTTTTSAEVHQMTRAAVARMAGARCQREVACDHVGPGQRHESLQACQTLNRSETGQALDPDACPRGIDQAQLSDCIAAIESASCLDPISAIVRVEECRASRLCLRGEGP